MPTVHKGDIDLEAHRQPANYFAIDAYTHEDKRKGKYGFDYVREKSTHDLAVYKYKGEDHYFVAFRGTILTNYQDLVSDAAILYGGEEGNKRFNAAVAAVEELAADGSTVELTGHSLGGSLTEFVMHNSDDATASRIIQATTFNKGVAPASFFRTLDLGRSSKLVHVKQTGDFISETGTHTRDDGSRTEVYNNYLPGVLQRHSADSFKHSGSSTFQRGVESFAAQNAMAAEAAAMKRATGVGMTISPAVMATNVVADVAVAAGVPHAGQAAAGIQGATAVGAGYSMAKPAWDAWWSAESADTLLGAGRAAALAAAPELATVAAVAGAGYLAVEEVEAAMNVGKKRKATVPLEDARHIEGSGGGGGVKRGKDGHYYKQVTEEEFAVNQAMHDAGIGPAVEMIDPVWMRMDDVKGQTLEQAFPEGTPIPEEVVHQMDDIFRTAASKGWRLHDNNPSNFIWDGKTLSRVDFDTRHTTRTTGGIDEEVSNMHKEAVNTFDLLDLELPVCSLPGNRRRLAGCGDVEMEETKEEDPNDLQESKEAEPEGFVEHVGPLGWIRPTVLDRPYAKGGGDGVKNVGPPNALGYIVYPQVHADQYEGHYVMFKD